MSTTTDTFASGNRWTTAGIKDDTLERLNQFKGEKTQDEAVNDLINLAESLKALN